jgi:hypothetical protein
MAEATKTVVPQGKDHTYVPSDAELAAAIKEYADTTDPGVVYKKYPWLRYFHPRCYKERQFLQQEVDAVIAEFGYDTEPAKVYAKYPFWRFHYPPPKQASPEEKAPVVAGGNAA